MRRFDAARRGDQVPAGLLGEVERLERQPSIVLRTHNASVLNMNTSAMINMVFLLCCFASFCVAA
jgi:hypothetical protein